MMTVACLHTATSNIAIFDQAAKELAIPATQLSHIVMPNLLFEAENSGGMTPGQKKNIILFLHSLAPFFDAIVITCSTLGPVADGFIDKEHRCRVYRADKMLADALRCQRGKSVVLCAAESTMAATTRLFCSDAFNPNIFLIPGAWQAFKAGDNALYVSLIADEIKKCHAQGIENVALAQVSMAPAAQHFQESIRPLTSPHLALRSCFGQLIDVIKP